MPSVPVNKVFRLMYVNTRANLTGGMMYNVFLEARNTILVQSAFCHDTDKISLSITSVSLIRLT